MSSQYSTASLPSPSGSTQFMLSGHPLPGHLQYVAPRELSEFSHWFQSEAALQINEVSFIVTVLLSEVEGWDVEVRECMLEVYRKLTGFNDVMMVRCNKLPRVFIAPRQLFDTSTNYIEIAGRLAVLGDEDSHFSPNNIPDTNHTASGPVNHISAQVVATNSPAASSNGGASAPATATATAPAANAARRGGPRNAVARPANCFILFRQHLHAMVVRDNPGMHNNSISAIISRMWHKAPFGIKEQYKALAALEKARHMSLHPGYKFKPRKSSEKLRRARRAKTEPTTVIPSPGFIPREDFQVSISAQRPGVIFVDDPVSDADHARALNDIANEFDFFNTYNEINGTSVHNQYLLGNTTAMDNACYTYNPLTYNHDLHTDQD